MFRHRFWPLKVLFFVLAGAALIFGIGNAVLYLWNQLVPNLFHGPTITLLQAFMILVLARILVGGLGGGRMGRRWGGHRGGWGRHQGDWHAWWQTEGKEAFENWQKNKSKE